MIWRIAGWSAIILSTLVVGALLYAFFLLRALIPDPGGK